MKVAFLYTSDAPFPPSFNNIKSYYVSRELLRRGIEVIWLHTSKKIKNEMKNGILFVYKGAPHIRLISTLARILSVYHYCITNKVDAVYVDEWLYFRKNPLARLLTAVALRSAGISFILDCRDPLTDYEVAQGTLKEGSLSYVMKKLHEIISYRFSSLLILPSRAYSEYLRKNGFKPDQVLGIYRGVDTDLFNPHVEGARIRDELKLQNKFVVGWFGIMHRYRQINEVIVPLIKKAANILPGCHILLGGKGPYQDAVKQAIREAGDNSVTYVGVIPYEQMPFYIAACDLLLCPVSTKSRFTMLSAWLKITESLAVGRPVVATRNLSSLYDLSKLKGVVWTGSTFEEFINAIKVAREAIIILRKQAEDQAKDFIDYSVNSFVSSIVDKIIDLCRKESKAVIAKS